MNVSGEFLFSTVWKILFLSDQRTQIWEILNVMRNDKFYPLVWTSCWIPPKTLNFQLIIYLNWRFEYELLQTEQHVDLWTTPKAIFTDLERKILNHTYVACSGLPPELVWTCIRPVLDLDQSNVFFPAAMSEEGLKSIGGIEQPIHSLCLRFTCFLRGLRVDIN